MSSHIYRISFVFLFFFNSSKASQSLTNYNQKQSNPIDYKSEFELNCKMSDKSIGKELTLDIIISKTKSNNLQSIKNLNLWGNELENLSILEKMPNLEVISLSVNRIASLRDFRHCHKLQELYLRKNAISDLREIRYLMKLPVLKVLWLHDNPCAQVQNYRQIVIRHLPNLNKLDNNPVSPQQKNSAMAIKPFISCYSEEQDKVEVKKQKKQPIMLKPQGVRQQKTEYKQKGDSSSQMNRNKNILMAVLSLMRELDPNSLEIVKREADSLIHQF